MSTLLKMEEQLYPNCKNCICSVCLIAESNGGAPGCGNCDSCKGERAVNSCKEFYADYRYLRYCEGVKEKENAEV